MKRLLLALGVTGLTWLSPSVSRALESPPRLGPGLRSIQLLSEHDAVQPGHPLTVGIRLDPLPDHHTYWRGPGIVGVPTEVTWTLPEGFSAGKLIWPPPTSVLMAGIVANGFKQPVLLLAEIAVPEPLTLKELRIDAQVTWMACAVTCNPGRAELSLVLPVVEPGTPPPVDVAVAKAFAQARAAAPPPAPADWHFRPLRLDAERIALEAHIPGLDPDTAKRIRFFCDDLQVDSDAPQRIEVLEAAAGKFRLVLAQPSFAPKEDPALSGVLHHPEGWPGLDSAYVEISAPWKSASPQP